MNNQQGCGFNGQNSGGGNNYPNHQSNRHNLPRNMRHNTRRPPADLTRDEAEANEYEYATALQQQNQKQQQQQSHNNVTTTTASSCDVNIPGFNQQQRHSPTMDLCNEFTSIRVDASTHRDGVSPPSLMPAAVPQGNYQQQQQQQQQRRSFSDPNNDTFCPSPAPRRDHSNSIYDDDDDDEGDEDDNGDDENGMNMRRNSSTTSLHQQKQRDFINHKQLGIDEQKRERFEYYEPVQGKSGMRRRVGSTMTGAGGNPNDEFLVSRNSNSTSRGGGGNFPGSSSSLHQDVNNVFYPDVDFPIPRRPFSQLGPLAQSLLKFVAHSSGSIDDVLEDIARVYQIAFEVWCFNGKLNDCYESLSQLSPLQIDVLLTFGGFTFSNCGKMVVPNSSNPALVPTVAALCDSAERILQSFSDNNNNNGGYDENDDDGGEFFFDDEFDDDGGDNTNAEYDQEGTCGSTTTMSNTVNSNTAGAMLGHNNSFAAATTSGSSSSSFIGAFRAWCVYANGFGWRDNRNDVPRICNAISQRNTSSGGGGGGGGGGLYDSLDVALFVDAMLTEAGTAQIASAMGATLLQAHDRYGSGLAILLRRGPDGKFSYPRLASEWHSDEFLPAMSDDLPAPVPVQYRNVGGAVSSAAERFQDGSNNNSSSNAAAGSSSSSSGNSNNNLARIMPCSSDGESKQVDFRNPPTVRGHALCVVGDTYGPLLSLCFLHLPQGRAITFQECSSVGFAFASWLGSLTVPNALHEHFVFLGVPLRVLNQQQHHATHARNIELVREVWSSQMSYAGWKRLNVAEQQQQQQNVANESVSGAPSQYSPSVTSTSDIRPFGSAPAAVNRFAATMDNFRAGQQNRQRQQQQQQQHTTTPHQSEPTAHGGNIVPGWILFYRGRSRYDVAGLPKGVFSVFQQQQF